jgi:oligoendopeptidase F
MGIDKVFSSDMAYPLTEEISASFTYEDGKNIILEALAPLGLEYQNILKKSYTENWIDVYPSKGKNTGAFAETVYGVHPYVLTNYTDDFNSVLDLAHELGHAAHMYLSTQNQKSIFNGTVTIFTSEVASAVNELLLTDYLIKTAGTANEKLYYLFSQLSRLRGTFFGQTMYAEFEDAIYKTVEEGGSLTADVLEGLWVDISMRYSGSDYAMVNNAQFGWSYIEHFYCDHYVYQYATSLAAACVISKRITNGEPGATEDYLNFLKAGNSDGGVELLKALGIDMTKTDYTAAFMDRYNSIVDQIEELLR